MLPTRTPLLFVLGVACTLLASLAGFQAAQAQQQEVRDTAAAIEERILPSEVTLENHDAFMDQLHRDLPLGTAKQDVEAYLARWEIPYYFLDARYGSFGNAYHAVLEDLGWYQGFTTRLNVWIHLDDTNLLREIRFRTTFF